MVDAFTLSICLLSGSRVTTDTKMTWLEILVIEHNVWVQFRWFNIKLMNILHSALKIRINPILRPFSHVESHYSLLVQKSKFALLV